MKKLLVREHDRFLKYHGPSVSYDWQKVRLLEKLTAEVNGIRTARPLELDPSRECIYYEWLGKLPRLISLRGESLDEMVCKLGRSLAGVHIASANMQAKAVGGSRSVLPLEMFDIDSDGRREIDTLVPTVFFHGDCWHGNVHIDDHRNCVLIDPIQSPWLFGSQPYDLASGIVDLATLHMSLIVSHRIGPLLNLDVDRQLEVGDFLIDSYLAEFGARTLRSSVLNLSEKIARKYVSTYPTRINTVVGWTKIWLSNRILAKVTIRNSMQ